jgi:hypothetical protein
MGAVRNLDPKEMTEEGHPLFLTDDEDEHPVVSQIQVTRMENGQQVYAPRMRQAAELQSLDQISGEFGGGIYVLVARHNGRIVTSRKYVIPGKPKPMYDEAEAPSPPTPAALPVANPGMMSGGDGGIMGMLVTMMQMMMQNQAQASQQNTQLMIAMMSAGRESSAEDKAAARAEMAQNIERERIASANNLAMMREMMALQSKPSGGAGEDFTRGVEFMRSFATQQIESLRNTAKEGGDTDWGSILETLGQVMQGVGMLKGMGGNPAESIPQVSEVVP